MASKCEDRHGPVNSPVTGVIPSIIKRKVKGRPGSSQYVQVKQIHQMLTESIAEMQPVDQLSSLAIEQLKIAQIAVATAHTYWQLTVKNTFHQTRLAHEANSLR